MTNITFFFLFIPFLALALLIVNFIFASHTPYQEKNSTFECGFHSFLGQNRMQFNISFYIFGLLFLLFDLEILLIYPYPVSAQFNSLYGLIIMLIFFSILTLGFTFELGKNALKIDSRQYDIKSIIYKFNNNHKLLNSGLFNKPVNLSNRFKDILISFLSGILVIIFFSFVIKFCLHSLNTALYSVLIGLISVVSLILKSIFIPCFKADWKKVNEILINNKTKFLRDILTRFTLTTILSFIIMFILYKLNLSSEFSNIYFGVLLCDDMVINPKWIEHIEEIDLKITDRESRFNKKHMEVLAKDIEYSEVQADHEFALKKRFTDQSPRAMSYRAWLKDHLAYTKSDYNETFREFNLMKTDLKKSIRLYEGKFKALPDNHPHKQYTLDHLASLKWVMLWKGQELKNKKVNPTNFD